MADNMEKLQDLGEGLENVNTSSVEEHVQGPVPSVEADRERFTSLMEKGAKDDPVSLVAEKGSKATLMDVVHDMNFSGNRPTAVDPQSLVAQTEKAVTKIDAIKETLAAPDISIKSPTHVQLLENKLKHIDENLRIALSKVGSEFTPQGITAQDVPMSTRVNPIERFLSFLSDGQAQLENLGSELTSMSINKKELSPVSMLAVQVKIGQISQELELFSNLLNQALQSIKTVMNIQV